MDIAEKRVPQDGRFKLAAAKDRSIDFRVSSLPTLYGEKLVLRILDSSAANLGIDALGYDARPEGGDPQGDPAPLRHDPRDRPDRQRQDHLALQLA